jgi:hypothetical protein
MSRHKTVDRIADTLETHEPTRDASEKLPSAPTEQATVTEPNLTPAERQTRDRDRIRKADPIGFLIKVMAGEPLPVVDVEGNVIGWERVDAVGRAATADRLLKRIVPELKSVELNSEGGGINIVLRRLGRFHLAERTLADRADDAAKFDRCFPVQGFRHRQDILIRRTCVHLSICHLAPPAPTPPGTSEMKKAAPWGCPRAASTPLSSCHNVYIGPDAKSSRNVIRINGLPDVGLTSC